MCFADIATPVNMKLDILKVPPTVIHPLMTPGGGFNELLQSGRMYLLTLMKTKNEEEHEEVFTGDQIFPTNKVSCRVSALNRNSPETFQHAIVLFVESILAREPEETSVVLAESMQEDDVLMAGSHGSSQIPYMHQTAMTKILRQTFCHIM